jgi:mRNA interferase RelE/StbE
MTYKLKFHKSALKEWKKLGSPIRDQFKKKLVERLENPRIESAKLSGTKDTYKIKLRNLGYRLAYHVNDGEVIVTVLSVGKRNRNDIYKKLFERLNNFDQ